MVEQVNKQNAWYTAFKNFVNSINYDIDCAFLAKVVKYDKSKHIADIQPLNNFSDGSNKAQLLDVPVSACCYEFDEWLASANIDFTSKIPQPLMHDGATVVAIVMDHDTDDWDGTAKLYTPATKRQHDINDSVIVGVI